MVRARPAATAPPPRPRRRRSPAAVNGKAGTGAGAGPRPYAPSDGAPPASSSPPPPDSGIPDGPPIDVAALAAQSVAQLLELAPEVGARTDDAPEDRNREALFQKVKLAAASHNRLSATGVLEVMDAGHGLLRSLQYPSLTGDAYVEQGQIRRHNLKTGDTITGQVRPPKDRQRRYEYELVRPTRINLLEPEEQRPGTRRIFESLTPIFPNRHIALEHAQGGLPARMIDLFAPIGLGQRGLVVSPPKAGKTTVLRQIAAAITENRPDLLLMVVLIGERPEEVTEMRRAVKGDVFASTFDESVEEQCRVAELAVERAKRMTETGRDVVILLDSITRLTRAYNLALPTSGRTMSGGIDPAALYPAKRFIGAARNLEEGGSLTIIATCLLDTGSRMDEVIYEEFKGTGNMELHLDRRLADQRYFPAIDVVRSGTRREELLYDAEAVPQIWLLRRMVTLASGNDQANMGDATKRVLERLARTRTNAEFLTGLTNSKEA